MKWGLSTVAFLVVVSPACSQEIGKVKFAVSQVALVRDGETRKAAPADALRLNEGRTRLVLLDGSELTAGPQTELLVVVANVASQQTTIALLYGRLRAHVTPATKAGGIFQVRTPAP